MRADAQTEAALLEILERFCSGFAGQDADGVMQLFAPEADIVMVTSEESLLRGPDEVKTFLHRYAQGTTRYSWAWARFDVAAAGAVGWVLAEGTETAAAEEREEASVPDEHGLREARRPLAPSPGPWLVSPSRLAPRKLGQALIQR
jgi:limonene-1,2-epoxide hydrolase